MHTENDQVSFTHDGRTFFGVVVAVGDFWTDVMEVESAEVWQVPNDAVTVVDEA